MWLLLAIPAVLQYDPAVDLNNLHHVKAIFRAPFLSGYLEDDTPIFVVGMPRSGSTLVEQMFASHSQVRAGQPSCGLQDGKRLGAPGADPPCVDSLQAVGALRFDMGVGVCMGRGGEGVGIATKLS
jgi:hypothetical protein